MEDALSAEDAVDAAIRFRVVRAPGGVLIEAGSQNDHLFDLEQVVALAHVALERGDQLSILV